VIKIIKFIATFSLVGLVAVGIYDIATAMKNFIKNHFWRNEKTAEENKEEVGAKEKEAKAETKEAETKEAEAKEEGGKAEEAPPKQPIATEGKVRAWVNRAYRFCFGS
jgi:biopolymer transport protein ExbB/TolQ